MADQEPRHDRPDDLRDDLRGDRPDDLRGDHPDDLRGDHPDDLRVGGADDPAGIRRDPAFTFRFDGQEVPAHPGETIAGALLAAGQRQLRSTRFGQRPRGLFCAIGTCFDCLVHVDGGRPVRACLTPAAPNLSVASGPSASSDHPVITDASDQEAGDDH